MKNFKNFKESTAAQDQAKERIKREKEADKVKHDRIMDRARLRDTKTKNRMTEAKNDINKMVNNIWTRKGFKQSIRKYLDHCKQKSEGENNG